MQPCYSATLHGGPSEPHTITYQSEETSAMETMYRVTENGTEINKHQTIHLADVSRMNGLGDSFFTEIFRSNHEPKISLPRLVGPTILSQGNITL